MNPAGSVSFTTFTVSGNERLARLMDTGVGSTVLSGSGNTITVTTTWDTGETLVDTVSLE